MERLENALEQLAPVVDRDPRMTTDGKLIDIRCWKNLEYYTNYKHFPMCEKVENLYSGDYRHRLFGIKGVNTIISGDNEEEAVKFALLLTKKSIEYMITDEEGYYSSYDEDEMYDEGISIAVVDISKISESEKNNCIEIMSVAVNYTNNIFITGIGNSGITTAQMDAIRAARYCFHNVYIMFDERHMNTSLFKILKMQYGFSTVLLENKTDQEYQMFVESLIEVVDQPQYSSNGHEVILSGYDSMMDCIRDIKKKCRGNITEEIIVRYLDCGIDPFEEYEKIRGIERLEQMVGLKSIKQVGKKFMARAREVKLNPRLSMDYQNMLLVGEPGTGKSTVAEIIAEIIEESGIGNGCFVRAETKDLIGQYVGQTAPRVADCFARARGGVLFVDEAGALLDDTEYTKEAIKEFVRYMEQYSDVTVMFAMYPEEAKSFLRLDFGLASRIRHIVKFDNYSNIELYKILDGMLENNGYRLPKGVKDTVFSYIDYTRNITGKNFGNAREMRKLADEIVTELCLRHMRSDINTFDGDIRNSDVKHAVNNLTSQAEITKETKNVIGFVTTHNS